MTGHPQKAPILITHPQASTSEVFASGGCCCGAPILQLVTSAQPWADVIAEFEVRPRPFVGWYGGMFFPTQ